MQSSPCINLDRGSSTPFLPRSFSREGRGAGPFARSPCMGRGPILSRWDQAYCNFEAQLTSGLGSFFQLWIGFRTGHGCIRWGLFEVCRKVARYKIWPAPHNAMAPITDLGRAEAGIELRGMGRCCIVKGSEDHPIPHVAGRTPSNISCLVTICPSRSYCYSCLRILIRQALYVFRAMARVSIATGCGS